MSAFATSPRGSDREGPIRRSSSRPVDLEQPLRIDSRQPDGHLGGLEAAFRARHYDGDTRIARGVMASVAAFTSLLLVGWIFAGRDSGPIVGLSALTALISVLAAPVAGSQRRWRARDGATFLWFAIVALAIAAQMLLTVPRVTHTGAILFLFGTLALLPLPFAQRTIPAGILTIATAWNAQRVVHADPDRFQLAFAEMGLLAATLVIGILFSVTHRRGLRKRFLAEARLAERRRRANELSRLLPVCGYCEQVRSDDGFWEEAGPALERRRILSASPARCVACAGDGAIRPEHADEHAPPARGLAEGRTESSSAGEPAHAGGQESESERPARSALARWIEVDAGVHERRYRTHYARADQGPITLGCIVVMVYDLANFARALIADPDADPFTAAQVARLVPMVAAAITLAILSRTTSIARRDRILFAFIGALAVASGVIVMPGLDGGEPTTTSLVVIAGIYLLAPLPLWMRIVPSFACTVLTLGAVVLSDYEAGGGSRVEDMLGLVFVNGIGLWAARSRAANRRAAYLAGVREREEIERVEALEGLMPMCGSCGSVRDDSGYWSNVFEYLRTHTAYRASHGICPSCMVEHHADVLEDEELRDLLDGEAPQEDPMPDDDDPTEADASSVSAVGSGAQRTGSKHR